MWTSVLTARKCTAHAARQQNAITVLPITWKVTTHLDDMHMGHHSARETQNTIQHTTTSNSERSRCPFLCLSSILHTIPFACLLHFTYVSEQAGARSIQIYPQPAARGIRLMTRLLPTQDHSVFCQGARRYLPAENPFITYSRHSCPFPIVKSQQALSNLHACSLPHTAILCNCCICNALLPQ